MIQIVTNIIKNYIKIFKTILTIKTNQNFHPKSKTYKLIIINKNLNQNPPNQQKQQHLKIIQNTTTNQIQQHKDHNLHYNNLNKKIPKSNKIHINNNIHTLSLPTKISKLYYKFTPIKSTNIQSTITHLPTTSTSINST